jgi:NAD(P)-dependent dehydrogenase (short-subunit alcohol dehydrogenase family)
MELVDAPIHQRPTTLATDRIVLITDDGCGIAAALTAELQKRGVRVVLLECGSELAARGDDRFVVDLTAPGSVADLIDVVRNRFGSIGMILHLLPLKTSSAFSDIDFDTWRERLRLDVKSLFYLTKAAASDLQDSSADGACVLAASHIGLGRPGGDASSTLFPGHKGLNGFLKTLALEWPGVRAKAVDLDAEAPVEQAARQLMEEILSGDLLVEVSYDGDRRLTPTIRAADLAGRPPAGIPLESSSVVLITGGARGVTAKVARLLAEHYQPTLILAGRSPLPVPEEAAKTAGITEAKELKAALMSMMREKGEKVVPATVEKAYARLIADREMRSNMEAMRRLGADVHYFPVDVRDAEAFGGLIDQVYESFGRLDGVVHGAGVIEDKLIVDKTAESFDRTFDTKTDSAFVLSRKLRPATLRFLVLFSSVAGSFGNRGQSDYAAANEVLNQLARQLDAAWSARVVSINWGPWDTPGMVSPELRKQFAVRGVELIPPDVGLRMFEQELACGNKGESQVIVGGAGWGIAAAKAGASQRQLPLTTSATASRVNGHYEVIRELDPANDIYLLDHRIDGKPVLPLAVATELIAETVAMGWPDRVVTAVEDLYMLKGLVMDAGVTAVRVVAEAQSTADTTRERVIVQIQGAEEPRRAHYRAVVEISDRLPHPPALERINLGSRVFAYSVPELYQNWLFHGPSFQGIAAIDAIGPLGVRARLKASVPSSFFARPVTGEWLIDPLVFDSGLQLLILWSRDQWDMTTLPSRFRCYRRYGVVGAGPAFCEVAIRPETSMPTIHTDIFFRDSNGSIIGVLEDMEGSSSTTLNRLVGVRSPAIESGR